MGRDRKLERSKDKYFRKIINILRKSIEFNFICGVVVSGGRWFVGTGYG